MRVREKRNVLPSMLFLEAIEGAKNELQDQQAFIEECIGNPQMLFSMSDQKLGKRALTLHIMNGFLFNDGKLQVHDFQVFLADVTNQFVQTWAKTNGIKESISVEVRQPNTYPSLFAIYLDDQELIQFSILEKFYGVRDKIKNENEIRKEYQEREDQIEGNIKPLLERVNDYEFWLKQPHRYIRRHYQNKRKKNVTIIENGKVKQKRNIKVLFKLPFLQCIDHYWVIFKRDHLVERLNERLESTRKMIDQEREKLKRYPPVEHYISEHQKRGELINQLLPLFREFKYRLESERYKLY